MNVNFGRTSVSGGFEGTLPASGVVRVYKATLAQAGTINELWTYVRIAAGTGTFRCVLYAADGVSGEPGTLLAVGADLIPPVSASFAGEALRGGAVVAPVALSSGNYWLGLHNGSSTLLVFDDDSVGVARLSVVDTFADGTNASWPGTSNSYPASSIRMWGVVNVNVPGMIDTLSRRAWPEPKKASGKSRPLVGQVWPRRS